MRALRLVEDGLRGAKCVYLSVAVGDYGYLGSLHHSGHASPYSMGSQYGVGVGVGVGGPLSPGGSLGAYVQPATSTDDLYLLELGFPPRPPKANKKIKRLKSGDPAGQAKRKSREGGHARARRPGLCVLLCFCVCPTRSRS